MHLPPHMVDLLTAARAEGVTVLVKDSTSRASAGLHLYDLREDVLLLLIDAWLSGACGYPDGTLARLAGAVHPRLPGNFGMEIVPPPSDQDVLDNYVNYVIGSLGVAVLDCEIGTLTFYAGTLAVQYPDPIQMPDQPPLM